MIVHAARVRRIMRGYYLGFVSRFEKVWVCALEVVLGGVEEGG